jgi:AraC family transcriptional regulator, regulatory protein of adaptative response / DNA-3-methyladenine glycosylase II
MLLDPDICDRALAARDARFDGVFFVAITTTGIYCRPVCPARVTHRERRRFFATAAGAERAGFRPCLRCRPELAPGLAAVDAVPRLAQAAALRIAAGALNERGVDDLAAELGVSARQLRRALVRELGVSPVELAQTHRLLLAKRLLTDTPLPIARVAFASGFGSVRRFNTLFRARYRLNPGALRPRAPGGARAADRTTIARHAPDGRTSPGEGSHGAVVTLTLAYRPPLAWEALLAFLAARATPGVEAVEGEWYGRTLRVDGHAGVVFVDRAPRRGARGTARPVDALRVRLSASLLPALMPLLARLRHLFDLDADPVAVEAHLARVGLAALVCRTPGLRVPGAVDGFDLALRAVLGQQVSVRAATTLAGRVAAAFGERLDTGHPALTHLAATAERVADATVPQLAALGLTQARAHSILTLARAVAAGALRLGPGEDVAATTRRLTALPGIGEWTAQYVAMRALRWPDAFPAADLALRRAWNGASPAELARAATPWRPWRAYAAVHLWAAQAGGTSGELARASSGGRR